MFKNIISTRCPWKREQAIPQMRFDISQHQNFTLSSSSSLSYSSLPPTIIILPLLLIITFIIIAVMVKPQVLQRAAGFFAGHNDNYTVSWADASRLFVIDIIDHCLCSSRILMMFSSG